jgi:DNA-binding CsgD family transcriptional regulator
LGKNLLAWPFRAAILRRGKGDVVSGAYSIPRRFDSIVGRRELLASLIDDLRGRTRAGVVLAGPAGVGKSRLAQELATHGVEQGMAVSRTVVTKSAASIPLGALAPLLPGLGERGSNPLAEATAALESMTGEAGLILLVDDAHLLDDHSASLLVQLALVSRAYLVITLRDDEPAPESLITLWKDDLVRYETVPPLDPTETSELVESLLGGPAAPDLRANLVSVSEGNPLVINELILGGRAAGVLRREDGTWFSTGALRPSRRLADLVLTRIGALDGPRRRALELLACGEPIGIGLLETMVPIEALAELEGERLMAVVRDRRRVEARLAHPIYGEVIRGEMGHLGATAIMGELATMLAGTGMRRREDVIRGAMWRLDGGGAPDPDLLLSAAEQTYRLLDLESTTRLASAAWEARPDVRSGFILGTVLRLSGRPLEAEEILGAATPMASDDREVVMLAGLRAVNLAFLDRPDEAREALDVAESRLTGHPGSAMLAAERATLAWLAGDLRESVAMATSALAGDDLARVAAAGVLEPALLVSGRHVEAGRVAEGAVDPHRLLWQEHLLYYTPSLHDYWHVLALTAAGDTAAAGVALDRARARAEREEAPVFGDRLRLAEAWLLLARGRPASALEAVETARAIFSRLTERLISAARATALAMLGRPDEARGALAEVGAGAGSVNPLEGLIDLAEAWIALASGLTGEARNRLLNKADRAIGSGNLLIATESLLLLLEAGDATRAIPRLREIAPLVEGHRANWALGYAEALETRDGEGLASFADEAETRGWDLLALAATTAAARESARGGDQRRATALRRRAAAILGRCEGARLPWLAPDEGVVPLTDREREIATMASQGMTSKEIADRLYLSARTVDNHLQRVYQKLGISGRDQLVSSPGAGG